ncbi:MAG: copper chaperone PCu(A)C [Phyllobacteriaceae bacterium]|nr:copper chaperone PCu(A)C [Phyllobacteriaceae bacterium]
MTKLILTAAAALLATGTALAHDYSVGDLVIDHPVARATPANAPVSGGYMTIRNNGEEADRLVAGTADFAGKVEIHEMVMDGDVMKMREIEGGIEIPAGGEVVLKPGGLHVMFMQLEQQLEEGAELPATLTFEKAGDVTVTFNVESLTQIREHMAGGMDHGSMDHSGHSN